MSNKKKYYKKGTKVRLRCNSTYAGTDAYEDIILEEKTSEEELDSMAREFMYESLQPECWFELVDEEE